VDEKYLTPISDVVITKRSKIGKITYKIVENDTFRLGGFNILNTNSNNVFIMGFTDNFDYTNKDDYIFQQFIYEFDSSLNLVRKILSPKHIKLGCISDLVVAKDESIYCSTSDKKWTVQPLGGGNYDEDRPAITKYDSSGNYLWTKSFVPQAPFAHDTYNAISFDKDSTNIVAVGGYNTKDTSIIIDTSRQIVDKGIITKLDLSGTLVWNRLYIARGDEFGFNFNQFYDIKRLSAGGYILCGSSELADKQSRDLLGWLMKVDEEGCFIPGCNLVNISKNEDFFDIKIFPNPANEYISVIHGFKEKLNLELISIQGEIIERIENILALETNILFVGKLTAGEYILSFKNNNGIQKYSKKIIICH
jgi:hypothetical protein